MRTVYIHVGCRKSGTTSLQVALRASRDALAEAGYALPLIIHDGSDRGLRRLKSLDGDASKELVAQTMQSRLANVTADKVLISNEFLAELSQASVDFFFDQVREHFDDAQIVVIITARPWSKVIGSEWQEAIKSGGQHTFADAVERIRTGRDRRFHARHDLPSIVRRWGRTLAAEDVSVVAVPPPTRDGPGIFEHYCDIVGLDPGILDHPPVEVNQSLNPAQAELLRRMNVELGGKLKGRVYRSAIRHWIVPHGFTDRRGGRAELFGDAVAWCAAKERRQVAELLELDCRLVGAISDLTPEPTDGLASPLVPTDAEVVVAAARTLAELATASQFFPRPTPWWVQSAGRSSASVGNATLKTPFRSAQPSAHTAVAQGRASEVLDCKIASNTYGLYCVPATSVQRRAARRVIRGGVYEPETIEFIRANCGDRDVIHAGTYFGDFLPGLSSGIAAGALIWAFEPNSENHRCAEMTMLLNKITNVRLHNAGLGAEPGESLIQVANAQGQSLGGASRIVSDSADGSTTEKAAIETLDDVVPSNRDIGILHLDVEGFEQQALMGAFGVIRRCRPIMILEQGKWNEFLDSDWFAENVLNLGYTEAERMHLNRVYRPTVR